MTDRLANAQERAIKMMETTFKQCYQEGYNEGYECGLTDAWKKVKEEMQEQHRIFANIPSISGILADAIEIVDKHLAEVENDKRRSNRL